MALDDYPDHLPESDELRRLARDLAATGGLGRLDSVTVVEVLEWVATEVTGT